MAGCNLCPNTFSMNLNSAVGADSDLINLLMLDR